MRRAGPAVRVAAAVSAAAGLVAGCSIGQPLPLRSGPTAAERDVLVTAVDRYSGEPVADAQIAIEGVEGVGFTDRAGRFVGTADGGAAVVVEAEGYEPSSSNVPSSGELEVALRPTTISGVVTDGDGAPIAGARVFVDGTENSVETSVYGRYRIAGVPEDGVLVYKAAGHTLAERSPADEQSARIDVALEPFAARALYAPAGVFEGTGRLDALLDLIDRTEVNALVIDVKETDGRLYYATDLPEAVAVGAVPEQPILDLDELLPMLEQRGIYTIARMMVVKDNTLGSARPDLAVRNVVTGQPWTDYAGHIWLDPLKPGVWEYVLAIAEDVADQGFDEVQFDYVRFLSDGPFEEADLTLPNYQSHRLPAVRRLFRMADEAFDHRRAFLSADVFPISFLLADDQGIGQRAEVVMPYVDYLSPMLYPSHFGPGMFGYEVPNDYPYEVIDASLERILPDTEGLPVQLRPWIQDFSFGSFRAYTAADVRAQIQALYDNGVEGWMIWNAAAQFTEEALGPPEAEPAAGG